MESRRCGGGDERAFGDVGVWFGVVVPARRDVVRSVGVKQRSERLDMLAADIEFELAATVELDVVFEAVSDGIEQALDGSKPGGFDVEPARDRKSTRLNSSHVSISYAVFCVKTD